MLSDVATVVDDAVAKVSSSKTADPDMPVLMTGLSVVSTPLIVAVPLITALPVADAIVNLSVFIEKSPAIDAPKVVSSDPVTVKAVPDSETIESDIVEPVAHFVKLPVVPVPWTPVWSKRCHTPVVENIAQSPTSQSVIPLRFVDPATLTM